MIMARPKKEESDKLTERMEIRAEVGTKDMLEEIGKHYGVKGYNAVVRFLAVKEARRLKIELPKPKGENTNT